eukprot:3685853-Lingulodinium_polyedra.AAC.1
MVASPSSQTRGRVCDRLKTAPPASVCYRGAGVERGRLQQRQLEGHEEFHAGLHRWRCDGAGARVVHG